MPHRIFFVVGIIAMVVLGGLREPSWSGLSMTSSSEGYSFNAALQWQDAASALIAVVLFVASLRGKCHVATDRPAGLFRRLVSFLVDFFVNLSILILPATFLVLLLESTYVSEFAWVIERETRRPSDSWISVLLAMTMIAMVVLFALPISRSRQSVGGVLTNTRVLAQKPTPLFRSTRRTILGYITLCAGLISIPMALSRKDRRMWHDLYYDTQCVLGESARK